MPKDKIKVGACQIITTENVYQNTKRLLEKIKESAKQGIEIISFPEGALFGYCCDADYWDNARPEWFKDAESSISIACRENNIAVVVGSAHKGGENWLNSLAIFDSNGTLKYRYGKTFLAGEKWCINNKGALPIVNLAGVDCCFLICHDIRYPELVRLPSAMGAQICFFCSCESGLTSEYKLSAYRAMPISRATENGIYLVMANTPASKEDINAPGSSHGNSKIVHPDGNVMIESGFFTEEIVSAELDLTKADGGIARRAVAEDTILHNWMTQGLKLVVKVP
ncbi:MAG: Carbon-nitrogen hydrolase family protein [Candidatus Poribacteria bacterium]|nr:Carbon-nitrogen hydrolase family protein [Candidatus Poribacteria bacterium]